MAYVPKKRIIVRRKKVVRRKAYKKPAMGNKRITRVVKQVLGRQVETKCIQQAGTIFARPPESAMTTGNWNSTVMCLTPQGGTLGTWSGGGYLQLGNGIGEDQRIANECKVKATYFNYQLIPQVYNVTTNPLPAPQIVTLWFIRPKTRHVNGLGQAYILAGADANFFENISNADSGLTGSPIDLLRKLDKDNYQVIAIKQHKIGFSSNLNTSNVSSTFGNNDFKQYVRGRVKMPGYTWKVDRNEFFQGQNTFVFATCHRADGSGGTGYSVQIPVICNFNLSVYYTDA